MMNTVNNLNPTLPTTDYGQYRPGIQECPHKDFGQRLRQAVRDAKFPDNQEQLGKLWGVSQVTAGTWLRGFKLPPIDKGVRIAKGLGICVEWLYTGEGPKYPTPSNPIVQLATQIALAPESTQRILRATLEAALQTQTD